MKKIRVIVVDDHPAFREGLCRILSDESDLEIVANTGDSEKAITLTKELHPDVLIIDINMPKISGLEAAKLIRESCSETKILILTAYSYESYILNALSMGASGYILKNTPIRDLINAIHIINNGGNVFNHKITNSIFSRLAHKSKQGIGEMNFHRREIQILQLTAQGKTNKEIANSLFISDRTVQTHLVNIFRKLEVSTRTEAVLRGLRLGLLSIEDLP